MKHCRQSLRPTILLVLGNPRSGACAQALAAVIPLVLCCLAACGAEPSTQLGPTSVERQGLTPEELRGILGPEAGSQHHCAGPWSYVRYDCFKTGPQRECGVTPAVYREIPRYQPCRLREFGTERHEVQRIDGEHLEVVKVDNLNVCADPVPGRFGQYDTRSFRQNTKSHAVAQCQAREDASAKHNLGPEAKAECAQNVAPVYRGCHFGGKNSFITWQVPVTYSVPVYNLHFNDPACPPDTPERQLLSPEIVASCRHRDNGREPRNVCGAPERVVFSASNLDRDQLPPDDAYSWAAGPDSTAMCSTCDDLPWSTPEEAKAKFACLKRHYIQTGITLRPRGNAELPRVLAHRMQLLYEVSGNEVITRPDAEPIYGRFPTPGGEHRPSLRFPAVGTLALCERLSFGHVSPARLRADAEWCITSGRDALKQAPEAERAALLERLVPIYDRLLSKMAASATGSTAALMTPAFASDHELTAYIGSTLRSFATYYELRREWLGGDAETAWRATDKHLAELWQSVYAAKGVRETLGQMQGQAADVQAQALQRLGQQAVSAEALMLEAAYDARAGETMQPHNELILAITADAFQSLAQRIEERLPLHDFACLYGRCAPNAPSPLKELNRLLAGMQRPMELGDTLRRASAIPEEWRRAFAAVGSNPGLLHQGLTLAQAPSPGQSRLGSSAGARLGGIVANAFARAQRYEATGLFLSDARQVLRTGLNEARRAELVNEMEARKRGLEAQISGIVESRRERVADLLRLQDVAHQRQAVTLKIAERRHQLEQASQDLQGRRAELSRAAREYGTFVATVADLAKQPGWVSEVAIRQTEHVFSVSGNDAGYDGVTVDLEALRPRAARPLSVRSGDIVSLQVDGQYSPSGALAMANPTAPVKGALAGPDGYTMVLSPGRQTAVSNQHLTSDMRYSSDANTTHEGVTGSFAPNAFGLGYGPSHTEGTTHETGGRHEDQNSVIESDTTTLQISANYAYGTRLPNTPFPSAPAGALLAVLAKPGQSAADAVLQVEVVRGPASSILADADADVYFIVNDYGACREANPPELKVRATHLQAAGPAIEALAKAMAAEMRGLHARFPQLIAQGRLGPQAMASLARGIQANVEATCGDLGRYPASIRSLFDSWVSHLLGELESQIEIKMLERSISSLQLEVASLESDIASGRESERLLQLFPLWSARSVDEGLLGAHVNSALALADEYMWPVMYLFYPEGLRQLDGAAAFGPFRQALAAMRQSVFDDTPVQSAQRLIPALDAVLLALRDARHGSQEVGTSQGPLAMVRFVRPNAPATTTPISFKVPTADAARAKVVWDAIEAGKEATIALLPEDLYSRHGGNARLVCNELVPVVSSLAILFDVGSGFGTRNDARSRVRVPARLNSRLTFPTADGSRSFGVDPAFSRFTPLVIRSELLDSPRVFAAEARAGHVGQGLSPFASFVVDFAGLADDQSILEDARGVSLVMEVDYRMDGREVAGVRGCN